MKSYDITENQGASDAGGLALPQFEISQIYSKPRSAVWGRNQVAPPNGLWLAKSGIGGT
jgi:hypothetical protein